MIDNQPAQRIRRLQDITDFKIEEKQIQKKYPPKESKDEIIDDLWKK